MEREALRILAKLCTGGRDSWKGPEPFQKGYSGLSKERERERGKIIKKRKGIERW